MEIAVPKFQFRFMPAFGNVIYPGNFHPVGAQKAAHGLVDAVLARPRSTTATPENWLIVGGSGGFGSAARVVLGAGRGAHTLNVSYDQAPMPESANRVRKLGSPAFHRNLAIESRLSQLGRTARTITGDAFDPTVRARAIAEIQEHFGGRIDGVLWALATPRGLDPRTGNLVQSSIKPIGAPVSLKTFGGREDESGEPSRILTFDIAPGSPEEAVRTQYVMGGGIVERWIDALEAANVLANGCTLLTVSYRGSRGNAAIYRDGLMGLAKADLEFVTAALHARLHRERGGRAYVVEGPAVVTESSGGIPGVPFYLALLMDVLGASFEEPIDSMLRLFDEHFGESGPKLDAEGFIRMDDRELAPATQDEMARRFASYAVGDAFDSRLYDAFMAAYARTRGFELPGIDYEAPFDSDAVCRGELG